MNFLRVLRALWCLAGVAFILAALRAPALRSLLRGELLPRLNAPAASSDPAAAWFTGGFRADGAYPEANDGLLPPEIPRLGSYIESDAWQGRVETAWFAAPSIVHIGIAGYHTRPGNTLLAEFRDANGSVTRVPCPLGDGREQWNVWELPRPAGATAVRLVAADGNTGHGGWLAFSHPFTAAPTALVAAYLHAQVYATTALALTLLFGPGLRWRPRHIAPDFRPALLLGLGPALLAASGLAIWLLGGAVSPQRLGFLPAVILWLALGRTLWRGRPPVLDLAPGFGRAFAVTALVVIAVVAKSTSSAGPRGELFGGTISRNFSIGDRIDSRFSFYVVQAAAHHRNPAAPETERMFAPWTFFSRGPLAGLVALPIVLATGGEPPADHPDQPWSPFDPQGFAAYRITLVALAGGIVLAVFTVLLRFTDARWALAGAGLLALSPFGVHEMMFTWPKWAATSWAVLAFSLAHARRPLAAGLALAAGFFFHPLALLWAPWIGLWTLGRAFRDRTAPTLASALAPLLRDGGRFTFGVGLLVLPWMAVGALMPHLPDTLFAGQSGFLRYWVQADWAPATWSTWWHTRWMNFANTFLPLHVFFHEPSFNHPKFTSAYEVSAPLVKFAQLWWVSLPFALGLGLWLVSLAALARALRAFAAATWLFVFAPAIFITAYWGMDPLGLMRECAHPLFVALIILTVLVAARFSRDRGRPRPHLISRVLAHRATPWLQLPETWLMLWLTALAHNPPPGAPLAHFDTVSLTLSTAALLLAAHLLARARSPHPRTPSRSHSLTPAPAI